MANLGDLMMRLGLDLTGFGAAMDGVPGAVQKAAQDAEKSWAPMRTLGSSLTGLGTSLSAAITLPLTGLATISAKTAGDFEASMNRVKAISGATEEEFKSLRSTAAELGRTTQFTAKDSAQALEFLAMAGISATDSVTALPSVLQLAAVAGLDMARAADITTNILTGFGMSVEDLANANDVLSAAMTSANVDLTMLGESFKYAGPVAKGAGLSFEETAAAIALMGNAGIQGSMAGTSLRGAISRLLSPTKAAAEIMNELGLTAVDSSGKMLPMKGIIEQLEAAQSSMGGEAEFAGKMMELFGDRAGPAIVGLVAQGSNAIGNLTEKLQNSGGTAERIAKTNMEGLKGAWLELESAAEGVALAIGDALTPALQAGAGALTELATYITSAVEWFKQLPQPVQTFAIALGAVAAIVGPLALGLGGVITAVSTIGAALAPLAAGLGITVGAFTGWLAVIPLVTAALVALGVWVYDNWEAIKAVVAQAWEGAKEAWLSMWGWAVPYITGAWEYIASAAKTVWEWVGGFLSKVWTGIKDTAQTVWGAVVDAFRTFISWAEKIPGVSKLLNLDDAWKSAKKLQEQTDKASDAVKKHGEEHKKGAPKVKAFTGAIEEQKKGLTEAEKAAVRQQKAYTEMMDRYDREAKEFVRLTEQMRDVTKQWERSQFDLGTTFAKAHQSIRTEALKTVEIVVPLTQRIPAAVQEAVKANEALAEAYKALGITSSAELQRHASEAENAYKTIANSGKASARDIDQAWVKMEEARIAAAKAAGEQIPREQQAALDRMKEQLGVSTAQQKTTWSDWSKQVSTIVTDLGKDMGKILWDGGSSWGEKGKAMLKSLGEAATRMFVEPFAKAIGDLIGGALSDLIGGKGLGGVLDRLKSIGDAAKGVFGGGASAAGSAAGSAGSVGGSVGGGVGAAAGGVMGTVGAIGGVVSAVSGVIGNFQMAGMNKTLDLLEREVRIIRSLVESNVNQINRYLPELASIRGALWDVLATQLNTLTAATETIRDMLAGDLGAIRQQAADAIRHLESMASGVTVGSYADRESANTLREIRDALRERGGATVTIHVSGAGSPQATANEIARTLQMQLAY